MTAVIRAMILAGSLSGSLSAEELAENQARFVNVDGTVEILAQGSADWVDAHIDLPVEVGDQIRVGDDGHAELSLMKNVLVLLDTHTDVILGHTTMQEGHMTLTQGALLGKVESENGALGTWEFETPMGVCAIHGTEFAILQSEEHGTHLGVFKGEVQMSPADSATENFSPAYINAHEEGVLEKHKPLKTLPKYSPLMRSHFAQLAQLQKRFPQVAGVWVPLTPQYRLELRRKYVAAVKAHPVFKPRPTPKKRTSS